MVVHMPFPVESLLKAFQVSQGFFVEGEIVQGAVIALNVGLIGWATRSNEAVLDSQSHQPQGQSAWIRVVWATC